MIASDGQAAIKVLLEQKRKIDLILLDMRMPGMAGSKCFYRLREISPDVKIVMVTVQPKDVNLERLGYNGMAVHMNKPYKSEFILNNECAIVNF